MRASGVAFVSLSPVAVVDFDLEPFVILSNPKQLSSSGSKRPKSALIFLILVPSGAAIRTSHTPVTSFPRSISIVKTMPRQTTSPLNKRLIGIENPIEAYYLQLAPRVATSGSYQYSQRRTPSRLLQQAAECTSYRSILRSKSFRPALSQGAVQPALGTIAYQPVGLCLFPAQG